MKKLIYILLLFIPGVMMGQGFELNMDISGIGKQISDSVVKYLYHRETVTRTVYINNNSLPGTGDGSISKPFSGPVEAMYNLKSVIDSGIVITIKASSGDYIIDKDDFEIALKRFIKIGDGAIIFQGDYDTIATGFTLTAQSAPYVYTVNGATWETNIYRDKLLKSGNNFYGIIKNSTNSVNTVTGAASSTMIVDFTVRYIFKSDLAICMQGYSNNVNNSVVFEYIKLDFGNRAAIISSVNSVTSIRRAQIFAGSLTLDAITNDYFSVNLCSIVLSAEGVTQTKAVQLRNTTIRKSGTKAGSGISVANEINRNQHETYLENFTYGFKIQCGALNFNQSSGDVTIDNCTNGIALRVGSYISFTNLCTLYITGVDYLIAGITDAPASNYGVYINTINGTPTAGYLTSALAVNGFVNLANDINISIQSVPTSGTATLTSGSVTINTVAAQSGSLILVSHKTISGTPGILSIGTIVANTSFIINSSSASDNSTVNWQIIK